MKVNSPLKLILVLCLHRSGEKHNTMSFVEQRSVKFTKLRGKIYKSTSLYMNFNRRFWESKT